MVIGKYSGGQRSIISSVETNRTWIDLDPALFEANTYYDVGVYDFAGYPGAATGDYETLSPSTATGGAESGLVLIME